MGGIDIVLELTLIGLLTATLLHAVRLQKALGSLRADQTMLQKAVEGFESGTRQAESGLSKLKAAADLLGGQLGRAGELRDDLAYLSDRGENLADRLDALLREARTSETPGQRSNAPSEEASVTRVRSQAERSLLLALQERR